MQSKSQSSQIVSRKRVADHGEVFTAEREVKAMCDLVKNETENIYSRFLEPACGLGAFLIEILKRKLSIVKSQYRKAQNLWELHSIIAISSLYGIDILLDNVKLCQENLFDVFFSEYSSLYKKKVKEDVCNSARYLLSCNILWGNALNLQLPDGSERPIVFAEWSFSGNGVVKRQDYTMENLLKNQSALPKPIKDYPLIHFLKLSSL
jgi:hypothetical protein